MIAFLKKFVNSTIGTANAKPLDQLNLPGTLKRVQRGAYTGSGGNVTISAVVPEKTIIYSVSKGSAGTVAATGRIPVSIGSGGSVPGSSTYLNIQEGTTNLTTKQYSARLVDATTLYCDGAVEWQAVEYY